MKKEHPTVKRWVAAGIAVVILGFQGLSTVWTMPKDEAKSSISSLLGTEFGQGAKKEVIQGTNASERILYIPVSGVISDSSASAFSTSLGYDHQTVLDAVKDATDDPTVKAIFLDVDSPGGSTYASAELHDALVAFKETKKAPIYVSMGSIAASGGYYISAPADVIYATKETLTGSIGVIMSGMNYTGLLTKLGIEPQVYKSAPMKDIGSPSRPQTEEERAVMQGLIDSSYQRFLKVVEEGRHMSREQLLPLADGRIFDGEQAKAVGLVDRIGYRDEALDALIDDAKLEDPEVYTMTTNLSGFASLFSMKTRQSPLSEFTNLLKSYETDRIARPMYMMPGGGLYE